MAGWLIVVSTRGWISVGPGPISVRCGGWNEVILRVAGISFSFMAESEASGARREAREMDRLDVGFFRGGRDSREIEQRAVQQVRRRDIRERAEDGVDAAGMLPFPFAQHALHLLALELLLGAAEVAGDDGKLPQCRVGLEIVLFHVSERADHDVPAVVAHELRRHGLELSAVEEVEEEGL